MVDRLRCFFPVKPHEVVAVASRVNFKILLMSLVGRVKHSGGMQLSHHFETCKFDFLVLDQILHLLDNHLRSLQLSLAVVENSACVLGTAIIHLGIFVSGVVELEKESH